MTEVITAFARYFPLFQELSGFLNMSHKRGSTLDCLVIGPGGYLLDNNTIGSYQAFELANSIERAGICDYSIDVIDINEEVLQNFSLGKAKIDYTKGLLRSIYEVITNKKIPKNMPLDKEFWTELFQKVNGHNPHIADYLDSFFMDKQKVDERTGAVFIEVGQELMSHFRARLVHVAYGPYPKEAYDVVVCTAVLGCCNDSALAKRRVQSSVRPGGLLLSEEVTGIETGWKELAQFKEGEEGSHLVRLYQKDNSGAK